MNWENVIGGALASLIAVALLEGLLLPLWRRWRLRGMEGTYHIHDFNGNAITNAAGEINSAKVNIEGWFATRVVIDGFDHDTQRSWKAKGHFDEPGVHGYCYYVYDNRADAGHIELFALGGGTWAARTHAYHTNRIAIFHWKHKEQS